MKEYLLQKNVAYTEYDLSKDRDKIKEMVDKSGQMGVPVVIIDENVVVGFNQSKIDELLAS